MNNILPLLIIPFIALGQNLWVQNPSFEGLPGNGITPAPWETCMDEQTPDTQPGIWGINLPASDGNTYLGFVHTPQLATATGIVNWQEGASQELLNASTLTPEPMISGTTYALTIDIAGAMPVGVTGNYTYDAEILIYGGYIMCPQNELLWSSGNTPNDIWTTYLASFTPNNNYTHIMIQINKVNPNVEKAYILIDNLTQITSCQIVSIDNFENSCDGNNGFIETSILELSGTPPFSYLWSNGETSPNIYNLSPGTYALEVTDSDGDCVSYLSQEITGLEISSVETNPSCEGQNNGMIEISLSGGAPPYQYLWSNGTTAEDLSNVEPGLYSITITDANDCVTTEEFTLIAEPIFLIVSGDECNQNFDISINDQNALFEQWILVDHPEGDLPDFEDINSPSTQLSIYEEGSYTIGAIVCEDTIEYTLSIDEFIFTLSPSYQNCILSADVVLLPNNGLLELFQGPSNALISDQSPHITVESFGLYTFQYTACDNRVVYFNIAFGCPPIIPNVLTLNDDENNDLFIIHLLSPELYSESILTIYNRWGDIVFMSKQYGMNTDWWDGKHMKTKQNVNTGTYYYVLELFHNTKEEKDLFSGYIEILNDPN